MKAYITDENNLMIVMDQKDAHEIATFIEDYCGWSEIMAELKDEIRSQVY